MSMTHHSHAIALEGAATGQPLDAEQAAQAAQWSLLGDQRVVRNVALPLLLPVLPEPARANGQAVLIAPGGAYQFLSVDSEGLSVAQRLAEAGVAAFVLLYRVDATPRAEAAFADAVVHWFAAPTALVEHPAALEDACAAMALLRLRAREWGFDPARIGFIGFSAGAHLGQGLLQAEAAVRPDTLSLIYGPLGEITVPPQAPPLYVAMALDDPLFAVNVLGLGSGEGLGLVQAWRRAGRPVELHLYERGGHGFGMRPQGSPSDCWFEHWLNWLVGR